MKNYILIIFFIGLSSRLTAQINNSLWSHVGPISENLQNGNLFETGRLEMITINPNSEQEIFVGGFKTGLWRTTNSGDNWINISTIPIGTNAVSAIAFDKNNMLLVANRIDYPVTESLDETTGMFKYDPILEQWFVLGNIPIVGRTYTVNTIAVDPLDDNHILAGTSHGLYRSTDGGTSWLLVSSAQEYVQLIEFVYDNFNSQYDVYYTGTNIDLADTDQDIHKMMGTPIMARSTNSGITFTEINSFGSTITSNFTGYDIFGTTFCTGSSNNVNETIIYTYTARDPHLGDNGWNIVSKTIINTQLNTSISTVLNDFGGSGSNAGTVTRMSIVYDNFNSNNRLWVGATQMSYIDLNDNSIHGFGYSSGNILAPTKVHADVHDVFISPANPNIMYAVSDGGFYKNSLITPNTFEHKSNGLNIAMINGFSGSSNDPNYFLVGLHDIVHTSMYDKSTLSNRYTHRTHENDGGIIDSYNNDIVILDRSSSNALYKVSTDGGATLPTGSWESLDQPTEFALNPYFQDPYRKRIYAGMQHMSFAQFNFTTNKFDILKGRIHMSQYLPLGPNDAFTWKMQVRRMDFSRTNENSVHLITLGSSLDYISPGEVIQYIGNDFDAMTQGSNEHYDSNGDPQWRKVSPEWTTLSNMTNGFNSIPASEVSTFQYTGVVKSQLDDNVVFICATKIPNNSNVKVLRFNNSNWINYSAGIPSNEVPASMIGDPMSNDGLYLITESNVYFRDASMSSWMPFSTEMPQIFAHQMEINMVERTLRAGTYGRGIWKTCLKCPEDGYFYETVTYTDPYTLIEGGEIESISTVNPTIEVNYKANTIISLKDGFHAKSNSDFRAVIASCTPQVKSSQIPVTIQPASDIDLDTYIASENSHLNVFVYPNPSNGEFKIKFEEPNNDAKCSIVNLRGQIVNMSFDSSRTHEISFTLSGHSPGMYILSVEQNGQTFREKIILE